MLTRSFLHTYIEHVVRVARSGSTMFNEQKCFFVFFFLVFRFRQLSLSHFAYISILRFVLNLCMNIHIYMPRILLWTRCAVIELFFFHHHLDLHHRRIVSVAASIKTVFIVLSLRYIVKSIHLSLFHTTHDHKHQHRWVRDACQLACCIIRRANDFRFH